MKKFLLSFLFLVVGVAYADNTIASKEYVDGQVSTLQTQIPAKNTNTVLTNTGTAGTVGEKAIYDSSAAYSEQQDSLVTAGAFNTAVQNALDSEFVCIERQAGTGGCLLYQIRAPYQKSKNLFNVNAIPSRNVNGTQNVVINNGDGSITITSQVGNSSVSMNKTLHELAPDLVVGKTYTLSFNNSTNYGHSIFVNSNGRPVAVWDSGTSKTITEEMLDATLHFYPRGNVGGLTSTISNIQIEEGSVATPYVPYGNIYMSQSN